MKHVYVRLEREKSVNVHVPLLHAYPCVDAVEVVTDIYITVILNSVSADKRHGFFHIYYTPVCPFDLMPD